MNIRAINFIFLSYLFTLSLCAADEQPKIFPLRPQLRAPTDFYLFLGLGTQAEVAAKATQEVNDILQDEAVPQDQQEKRRTELIDEYYAKAITQACTAKRQELQKNIQEAIKAVEKAEELEKEAKTIELIKLQYDFYVTTHFCPFLLNPSQRRAYDKRITDIAQTDVELQEMQHRINEMWILSPSRYILLNQLITSMLRDLIKDVPGPALKIFNQDMALRSITALPIPSGPDVRYGIGFTGLMAFNKVEVQVSVYVIQDIYGNKKASIIVDLPEHYKLSDLIPSLTLLDTFSFPKAKLILANYEGLDPDRFHFKKGFNYVAMVDLKGPLAVLNALKDQSRYLSAIVFEGKPILLSGLINPFDVSQTTFNIAVPFYFGIDLQKFSLIPSFISNVVNKITTDELNVTILPFKKDLIKGHLLSTYKLRMQAESGARIVLGTQKDPLRLTFNGLIEPASARHPRGYISFGGNLKNMLEFNWLAIGNASLQLDYDPALVAITGYTIPFTGLLAKGEIDLGKPGDARAQLKVAGGFRVMTPEGEKKLAQEIDKAGSFELGKELITQERKKRIAQLPEILFDVEGENIRFADLLSYTTKLAAKTGVITKQIPVTVFPSMTLHKVWGHLALVDTRIADKEYKAGLGLQVETEFWQRKAGFRIALLPQTRDDKTTFQLSGWGYLPPLAMTARGKDIVRLHGEGEDKGPRLAFLFNPQMPDRGHFLVNATLIIPGLGLKQAIKFQWYYWWLVADFESKFAGFSVVFGVRLNTNAKPPAYALQMPIQPIENIGKQEVGDNPLRPMTQLEENRYKELEKWRQLYIKFGFKDDFAEFLNKQLVPALRSLKTQSLERLDKISLFIAQQQERGTDAVSKEIEKTDEEIARLKQEIAALKKACHQRPRLEQITCRASIAAHQAIVHGKNFYRNALLRPTKAIVRSTGSLAQQVAQARVWRLATESILEGASRAIEFITAGVSLLRVREAIGEYSYRDMVEAKLPRLVRLVVELNLRNEPMQLVLENLQFDFKAPQASCMRIGFELMRVYTRLKNAQHAKPLSAATI